MVCTKSLIEEIFDQLIDSYKLISLFLYNTTGSDKAILSLLTFYYGSIARINLLTDMADNVFEISII